MTLTLSFSVFSLHLGKWSHRAWVVRLCKLPLEPLDNGSQALEGGKIVYCIYVISRWCLFSGVKTHWARLSNKISIPCQTFGLLNEQYCPLKALKSQLSKTKFTSKVWSVLQAYNFSLDRLEMEWWILTLWLKRHDNNFFCCSWWIPLKWSKKKTRCSVMSSQTNLLNKSLCSNLDVQRGCLATCETGEKWR